MYKTTFQKIAILFNRSLTNLFSSGNVFGKLFLTVLIIVLSSNGIPDWNKNNGKNFKAWTWTEIKANDFIEVTFPPSGPLPDTHWAQRAGLQALNFKGKFYIFGGRTPLPPPAPFGASIIHGDGWRSSDKGENWERILDSNPPFGQQTHWANRSYFQAVKKGSYMYILGGQNFGFPQSDFFNDTWRSRDGIKWSQMTNPATSDERWEPRAGLSAVVFKGYIYVMGGSQNDDCSILPDGCPPGPPPRKYYNDVWRSRDGRNWEMVKENDPNDKNHWAQRAGGIAVVKGGYMYMIGGEEGFICAPPGVPSPCPPYFNDVWRTKDGVNWKRMIDNQDIDPLDPNPTHWAKRPGHQVVVAQNQLVLFGGFGLGLDNGETPSNPSDVWVSNNGSKWEKVSDAPWNAGESADIKYDFDAVVEKGYGKYSDAIYTFGGDRETFDREDETNWENVDNDVWKFSLPKKQLEEEEIELVLALHQNYPNPFSESTNLKYTIPNRAYVAINIFDNRGRFVSRLVGKTQNAGEYESTWNGQNYKGKNVKAGYYYAILWSQGKAKTIKMYKN